MQSVSLHTEEGKMAIKIQRTYIWEGTLFDQGYSAFLPRIDFHVERVASLQVIRFLKVCGVAISLRFAEFTFFFFFGCN